MSEPPDPVYVAPPPRQQPPAPVYVAPPERLQPPAPEYVAPPKRRRPPATKYVPPAPRQQPPAPEYLASPPRQEPPVPVYVTPPPSARPPTPVFVDHALRAPISGRQVAMVNDTKANVLSSAFFRIETMYGSADFSELTGISSELEQSEYMEAGPVGALFSRHAGRTRPPTVTLRRGMANGLGTLWIWTWHLAARKSMPTGQRDCALILYGPTDDPGGPGSATYMLMNAFPTKVELTGMKMGGTEVVMQTLTIQCEDIFDPNMV